MTTLLVVEDDEDTREVLRLLLETCGYRVVCAANGLEAARMLRNEAPALVLLDRMMPGMDGDTFVRVVCEQGVQTPIVMMSGHDEPEHAAPGVNERLRKPIDLETLLEVVRRWTSAEEPARSPE